MSLDEQHATPAPAESATPATTPDTSADSGADPIEAIITSSIAGLKAADGAGDSEPEPDDRDAGADGSEINPPKADAAAPTEAEIDELAQALGITASGKDKWLARVRYSKIHQAWKEQQSKLQAEHAKAVAEAARPHADKVAAYEAQIAAMEQLFADPDKFVPALIQANPAYERYLARQAANAGDTIPAPDVELTDGRRVYSAEQQQKRDEWLLQQATAAAEERIAKRYEPIEREHKQRQFIESALPRVQARLTAAEQKWPMFADHKDAILQALQADASIDLHDAYIGVVIPKLIADRKKMREELIAEMNAIPRTVATTPTQTRPSTDTLPPGMDEADAAIYAAMRKAQK